VDAISENNGFQRLITLTASWFSEGKKKTRTPQQTISKDTRYTLHLDCDDIPFAGNALSQGRQGFKGSIVFCASQDVAAGGPSLSLLLFRGSRHLTDFCAFQLLHYIHGLQRGPAHFSAEQTFSALDIGSSRAACAKK
jgi:hypothetical protein